MAFNQVSGRYSITPLASCLVGGGEVIKASRDESLTAGCPVPHALDGLVCTWMV